MRTIVACLRCMCASWMFTLCLAACGDDEKAPDAIVLAVYTDLVVGTELTSITVAVSSEEGESARATPIPFDPPAADSNFLTSFGIERGRAAWVRLKLTGYRPGATGAPEAVIEQLVEAHFVRGQTSLVRTFLGRACLGVLECGSEQTCDSFSGMCAAIVESPVEVRRNERDERVSWMPAEKLGTASESELDGGDRVRPPLEGTAGADAAVEAGPENPCKTGDGRCPEGCSFPEDGECLRPAGEICGDGADCQSGSCLSSYCCASVCSTEHVYPSCRGGDCQAGICEQDYADCNDDKATDGCETLLTNDPMHCGVCRRGCTYGVCRKGECVATLGGSLNTELSYMVDAGQVFGFRFYNSASGSLASLGFLVKEPNGAKAYIALFEDMAGGPYPQVAHSPELTIDQGRVEWILPKLERKEMFGGGKEYWVYFTFSKDTLIHASSASDVFWTSTEDPPVFGPIAEERFEDTLDPAVQVGIPSVFFNVVPELPWDL